MMLHASMFSWIAGWYDVTRFHVQLDSRKKNRQPNGLMKKSKTTNNDLQNTTQKTIDRVTRTLLQTRDNPGDPEGSAVAAQQVASAC